MKNIMNWSILKDEILSGHSYIYFIFKSFGSHDYYIKLKTKFGSTRFIKRFNNYNLQLIKGLEQMNNIHDLDFFTNVFLDNIQNYAFKSFRKRKVAKRNQFIWWNADLRTQRNKVTALYKRYKRLRDLGFIKEANQVFLKL